MKLKQIALAAAVVAAAGSAAAQMADTGVSVYGRVDANVNNNKVDAGFDGVGNTSQTKLGSSGWYTSRLGVKGTEDLGGGLSASFQLEGKINVDTGENPNYDNAFFGRQSWVGLSGNFGKLQLGKTWTSFDDVRGQFEQAANSNVGTLPLVWGTGALYDNNKPNQLKFTLPAMGGLTASIGYAFGEDKTASASANDTTSLNVMYKSGPFAVGYGRQNEEHPDKDSTFDLIGASYDLGAAKLMASWSQSKYNTISLGANATKTIGSASGDAKDKEYQLGVNFPMGSFTTYFGYGNSKVDVAGTERANADGYVLAVTYALSKRTTAYAGYTTATRKRNVGLAGATEGKNTTTTFGLSHAF